MSNVTQKIPQLMGGVSRMSDFDKGSGEVREAINAYPDISYGMTKRPGTKFLGSLGITEAEADQTYFFPIIREGRPRYLCGLRQANSISDAVKIWNLDTLQTVPVSSPSGQELSYGYLNVQSGSDPTNIYRTASDTLRTIVANRTVVCQEDDNLWSQVTPGFIWTRRGQERNANSIDDLPDGKAVRINFGNGGGNFPTDYIPFRAGVHYLPVTIKPMITDQQTGDLVAISSLGTGCVLKVHVDDDGVIPFMGAYKDGVFYPSEYAVSKGGYPANTTTYTRQQLIDAGGYTNFKHDAEIWAAGSNYTDQTPVTIDGIPGASCTIATGLLPGTVYRVVNGGSNLDDFYMQAFSNTSDEDDIPGNDTGPRDRIAGPYFWKECPSPDAKAGLNPQTLPHELIDNGNDSFTFKQCDYSQRWAGDNTNNPAPSFIGKKINNVLFLNNRLGFLSQDNVILSRPINYGPEGSSSSEYSTDDNAWIRRNYTEIDFFRQSAIGMTAADPIDMKAASNDVSEFHKAIPTPQGTLLFADGQQSLLFQPEGLLSPLTASINNISNYDMSDVTPIIIGETCYFINKGANFCRIYTLVNRGMQNPPQIQDITKEVSDWLPNSLTTMQASLTDNMLLTYARDDDTVYCRREVNENSSAWTKWVMPDKIVELILDHDRVYYLTKTDGTVQVHTSDMYVVPDDSAYVFAPDRLVDGEFAGIPSSYNYNNKIIGRKQLLPNKYGVIEYFSPSHDYYETGTENQYGMWLPLNDLGVTGVLSANASAIYSVTINTNLTDRWNIGVQIQYKSTTNEVITFPSETQFQMMPYDTLFRINYPDQTLSSFIDGCTSTGDCSALKYMTPSGTEVMTDVWGTEITNISTDETTAVVTLTGCNGGSSTYSILKSDFHDAYLLNIAKNNCTIDPLDYQYARRVISDSTITATPSEDYGHDGDPYTSMFTARYGFHTKVDSRSYFPIKDWWYKKNSQGPNYMSTLAPTAGSSSSLACSGVLWGRADEFFCQQNPGKMYGDQGYSLIEYNSSVNYRYNYSTNISQYYTSRPDINGSASCQYTSQDDIGDYNSVDGTVGRPWGTYLFIRPVSGSPRAWYGTNYPPKHTSSCAHVDKFYGWGLGGYDTYRGARPNVSGDRGVGFAYEGYDWAYVDEKYILPDNSSYDWDLMDTTGINRFTVSFSPPKIGDWVDFNGDVIEDWVGYNQYDQYVADFGQAPPGEIYIRTYYEFTNGIGDDPYDPDAEIFIFTDDVGDGTCDSCPPVTFTPNVNYRDLSITPYLDFYTNAITLETIVDDNDPTKLRKIVPPTNYPYIADLQPCLLIAVLPGQVTSGSAEKAGYQVDLTWNAENDALISPIDLADYGGKVIIGYRYNYMLELPQFYFRSETTDYTAALTIARIKLALGYSGDCTLQLRSTTNRPHWTQYFSATQANIYEADDGPITESSLHTMPVHQRSNDFYFRITSDSPFPLSVDSVTWEGNYSPRYYRRM